MANVQIELPRELAKQIVTVYSIARTRTRKGDLLYKAGFKVEDLIVEMLEASIGDWLEEYAACTACGSAIVGDPEYMLADDNNTTPYCKQCYTAIAEDMGG